MGFRDFLNSLCCDSCSIEVGGYIVAGLEIAKAITGMVLSSLITSYASNAIADIDPKEHAEKTNSTVEEVKRLQNAEVKVLNIIGWTIFACYLIHCIVAILYIIGLKQRIHLMMLPLVVLMIVTQGAFGLFSFITIVGLFFYLPQFLLSLYIFFLILGNWLNVKDGEYD